MRHRSVESFEKLYVLVCVCKMVLAADYVGYLHANVVHYIHKMEHRCAVGTKYRKVFFLHSCHVAVNGVVQNLRFARNFKKYRTVFVVRPSFFAQNLQVLPVYVGALALEIRSEIAAYIRAFVPVESKPFHPVF